MNKYYFLINIILILIIGANNVALATISCNIYTTEMNFGEIVNVQTVTASSLITVTCYNDSNLEQNVNYTIKFTKINHGLKNEQHELNYNIYIDNNYVNLLGDGTGNTVVVRNNYKLLPMSNRSDSFDIYGKLFVDHSTAVGNYFDKMLVTLEY